MERKVLLQFFEDDATGEKGLTHHNTITLGFNSFWDGKMMFHDVFEHYFEEESIYFRGSYAGNIVGEMAAAGHYAYYFQMFGWEFLDKRLYGDPSRQYHVIRNFTRGEVLNAIDGGYSSFGSVLLCNLPYQKDTCDCNFEFEIDDYICEIQSTPVVTTDPDERRDATIFKESCKPSYFRRAHRWGYHQAKKIFPENEWKHNKKVVLDFIDYWQRFCKDTSAEEMMSMYKYLEFTITTVKGKTNWKANFISHENEYVPHYLAQDRIYYYNYD